MRQSPVKFKKASIRVYLALSYTLFVIIGLAATGTYWFSQQEAAAERSLLLHLQERARLLSTLSEIDAATEHALQMPAPLTAINTNLRIIYVSAEGQYHWISDLQLNESQKMEAYQMALEALKGSTSTKEEETASEEMLYAAAPIFSTNQETIGAVCLVLPLQDFHATLNEMKQQLIAYAAILAIISLLLGIGLASLFTMPLNSAAEMASRVAGGDYSVRMQRPVIRELSDLSANLNLMAEELDTQTKMRTQVLSNVTHEIARPLGGLILGIDSLLNGANKDEEFSENLLLEIRRTLEQVEALVEDLALVARPQKMHLVLDLAPVDLNSFLQRIYTRFLPDAELRGIDFQLKYSTEQAYLYADENRLIQIMGNIVHNAIKFNQPGGEVVLTATVADDTVELSVTDNGPGIPPEDLVHILEPFYQAKNNAKMRSGMGIGLSIVNRLVAAHQGQLEFENMPWGGLQVRVTLSKVLNSLLD